MHKRYIIFCDESDDKGRFYSNFFGGVLIEASKQQAIHDELQNLKDDLHIFKGEMKWERITAPYAEKYIAFVNAVFDIVERGDMKIRVMFTQNRNRPILEDYQIGNDYFMLYYQFIKHAFGLQFSVPEGWTASAAVLLDDVPHNAQKLHQFKNYLSSLSAFPKWTRAGFSIAYEDIAEINSKDHNILQALDVVLGGMQSRLNEKHTKPQPPAKRRGKRTRAKAKVYQAIKDRVWTLYPNFNVGVSTGTVDGLEMRFHHPYRHWLFVPSNADIDPNRTKKAVMKKK
jgi:Protein of unknown function (DUF3800)